MKSQLRVNQPLQSRLISIAAIKSRRLVWVAIIMLLVITACSDDVESTPIPTTTAPVLATFAPTTAATPSPVSAAETATPPGYPAPPVSSPTPLDYPAPATEAAPLPVPAYPYPGSDEPGTVWVLIPVGEQCAEPAKNSYRDLQAAVAALAAAGIQVTSSEMISLSVCAACGCPTSAHFRAEIPAASLNTAQALGWFPE